jgi:hypothetical protein
MHVKHIFKHKLGLNDELVQNQREKFSSLDCSFKICNKLRATLQVKDIT